MSQPEDASAESAWPAAEVAGARSNTKTDQWLNQERVLVLCSRGTSFRDRHLLRDLRALLPHAKSDSKVDKKRPLAQLDELARLAGCSSCLYLEARKRQDLYLWLASTKSGPSVKFLVQNVHTSGELKMSGNCLRGSRPLLSFDASLDRLPHLALAKALLGKVFGVPRNHPRSQPFVDRVTSFALDDGRLWLRNYQLLDDQSARLEEIGPRLVLQPIKVLEGSFGGAVLYENRDYVCPNTTRRQRRLATAGKYAGRVEARQHLGRRRLAEPDAQPDGDPVFEAVFGAKSQSKVSGRLGQLRRKIDKKSSTAKKRAGKRRKMAENTDKS